MDVKAARRLGGLRAKQSRETARLSLRLIALQFVGERVEAANDLRLCGVGLEPALGNERTVAINDEKSSKGLGHAGEGLMRLFPVLRCAGVNPERHMQLNRGFWRVDHHFGDNGQGRLDFIVRRLEHQFVMNREQHPRA